MRLVVIGGYSLDVLQQHVVESFSDVPALPREPSPLLPVHVDARTWNETYQSSMQLLGPPFTTSSLGKLCCVVPVQDRHSLSITWQLPPQLQNWRTKPCDYIAHLLGHEAQGSLLSSLKEKSWVTSCFAGVGSEGLEVRLCAVGGARRIFNLTISSALCFRPECIITCSLYAHSVLIQRRGFTLEIHCYGSVSLYIYVATLR